MKQPYIGHNQNIFFGRLQSDCWLCFS